MRKLYYDKTTGFVSERYPYNYPKDENTSIEVDDKTYNKTLYIGFGYLWKVENTKVVMVSNPNLQVKKRIKYI